MAPTDKIRLIVLNFNGGDHVLRCVKHLYALDWPMDQLEIVVIDNASEDGSAARLAEAFPFIKLLRLPTNDGFPANNLAMRDLRGIRYVGLINNDAFVTPRFLAPLVAELDRDPALGAVSPLIVFEQQFVEVALDSSVSRAGRGDPRGLGVCVSGLEVEGEDVWTRAHFASGGHGTESSRTGSYEWTAGRAVLRVPVTRRRPMPVSARIRLSATEPKAVQISSVDAIETREIGVGRDQVWHEIELSGPLHDVVNNAGSIVFTDGYGADRGMGELDTGQFGEPVDLFAWCGGAVLLRPAYLEAVGLFDERFFLYYEDTDLSWRGRARGWSYRFVPESVVRHLHAASSIEGSERFSYYTERNRLTMVLKNAPWSMVRRVTRRYLKNTYDAFRRDVLTALARRRRPNTVPVVRRTKAFAGFVGLAPVMLIERRRVRRRQVVPDGELLGQLVDPAAGDRAS